MSVSDEVRSDRASLLHEAKAYKRATFAESTKSTYRSQLNCYLRFCVFYGFQPVPVDQITLIAYVAFLARSLKPTTINGYLNIVRLLHVDLNLRNPLENNFELQSIKRGIARLKGCPPFRNWG